MFGISKSEPRRFEPAVLHKFFIKSARHFGAESWSGRVPSPHHKKIGGALGLIQTNFKVAPEITRYYRLAQKHAVDAPEQARVYLELASLFSEFTSSTVMPEGFDQLKVEIGLAIAGRYVFLKRP